VETYTGVQPMVSRYSGVGDDAKYQVTIPYGDPTKGYNKLLYFVAGPNPTQQQKDFMKKRWDSAIRAREQHGIPTKYTPWFMSYDKSRVGMYKRPSSGSLFSYPLPQSVRFPARPYIPKPASYIVSSKEGSYASDGKAGEPGLMDFSIPGGTIMAHEGLLPLQGHYGTIPYGYTLGTSGQPIYGDEPGMAVALKFVAGLPRYSMNPNLVGGDTAVFGEWSGQITPGNTAIEIYEQGKEGLPVDNKGSKVHNMYINSPVEFSANVSGIKTVGAGMLMDGLNTFNPDDPDRTLQQLDELERRVDRGHPNTSKGTKRNSFLILDDDNISIPDVRKLIQRYQYLHDRRMLLNGSERNEYEHMRKALPSIWDQAINTNSTNYSNIG
jgi:hypothetical protein